MIKLARRTLRPAARSSPHPAAAFVPSKTRRHHQYQVRTARPRPAYGGCRKVQQSLPLIGKYRSGSADFCSHALMRCRTITRLRMALSDEAGPPPQSLDSEVAGAGSQRVSRVTPTAAVPSASGPAGCSGIWRRVRFEDALRNYRRRQQVDRIRWYQELGRDCAPLPAPRLDYYPVRAPQVQHLFGLSSDCSAIVRPICPASAAQT